MHFDLNQDQIYNLMGVYESMKRNKGVVIVGPICSGKTMLIKLITLAFKKIFHTTLRTSYVSPQTFSREELYGPQLVFDQTSVLQSEQPLQTHSIF